MNSPLQVEIDSMAFRGYGVARTGGKVLFIPHTVTGDKAWVEIIEEKKGYSFGRLSRLIFPSPWRTDPPCPYFGACGGCQWQHIDYSVHGRLKKDILEEILRRLGGVKEIPPVTVVPSPDPYAYRVRIQLKVEGKAIGYYRERSRHIIGIDRCPISHSLINQLILSFSKEWLSFVRMKEIEINVSPEEGKGIFILHPRSPRRGRKDSFRKLLQGSSVLKGCAVVTRNGDMRVGDASLNFAFPVAGGQEKGRLTLRASPRSFLQVNLRLNERLVETVLEFSEMKGGERVLDLYAGIGNFTLPLATQAGEVVGIEENGTAVEDGRFNAQQNRIRNCRFRHGRVEDLLKHRPIAEPDLVVLDPPRAGCKEITDRIVALKPKRIVYASCEPATFARDLRPFSEGGYRLQRLALFDMFPQTYHMEVVGLLQKGQA